MQQQHPRADRAPSPATIRRQAAENFHRRNRLEHSGFETTRAALHPAAAADDGAHPPAPNQVAMADLPFLTRRVLRIIAIEPGIRIGELDTKADLDRPGARPHADSLVLLGLVSRDEALYTLTHAGMQALQGSTSGADHDLAKRAGAYLNRSKQ